MFPYLILHKDSPCFWKALVAKISFTFLHFSRKTEIHTPIEEHPDERESDWCSTPTTFSRCTDKIPKTKSIFLIQYKTETIEHPNRKQCCGNATANYFYTENINNDKLCSLFSLAGYGKNKKGNQCLPICDCVDVSTSTCNDVTDDCNCIVGEKCKFKCPFKHFDENCSRSCSCKHGNCHHISGECICTPGWIGPSCELLEKLLISEKSNLSFLFRWQNMW